MEFLNVQNDYTWVVSVLESCLTEPQIEVSKNLFERFLEKWVDEISDERRLRLSYTFNKTVLSKFSEIKSMG
jgi:hypothetical protein